MSDFGKPKTSVYVSRKPFRENPVKVFVPLLGFTQASKSEADLQTIGALTHPEMRSLLQEKVIELDLFDEHKIHEVTDPSEPSRRYCLCRSPITAEQESKTRQQLLELTATALQEIAAYQRKTTVEKLGARVGKVLAKYKMGKFIHWSIEPDQLTPPLESIA